MNNLEARDMKREEELYLQAQYDKEMANYSEPVSFDMWKAAKAVVANKKPGHFKRNRVIFKKKPGHLKSNRKFFSFLP